MDRRVKLFTRDRSGFFAGRLRLALGVAVLALIASACADGGDTSDTAATSETTAVATTAAPEPEPEPQPIQTEAGGIVADPTGNTREAIEEAIARDDWAFPVRFIDCDAPGCQGEAVSGVYTPIPKDQITQVWNLCAALPHVADPYWVGTDYALIAEAKRAGVALTVLEAGGYTEIGTQVDQIDNCVASGADAILLGAVSNEALNAKIEEVVDAGVVVIDLINGVNTDRVAGRALFNYCLMGGNLGGYLASTGESVNAVWFPGPVGVGALEQLMSCFREQAEGSNVKLLGVLYGDTNKDDQLRLVENSFGAYPDMDYIVGSAVTVEAAIGPLEERGLSDEIRSASYYFTPGVYELIKSGDASCASTGHDIIMARIAVDLAIRKLEGVPFIGGYKHIGPDPLVVCGPGAGEAANNLDTFVEATTLPPDGFRPVFSYQP